MKRNFAVAVLIVALVIGFALLKTRPPEHAPVPVTTNVVAVAVPAASATPATQPSPPTVPPGTAATTPAQIASPPIGATETAAVHIELDNVKLLIRDFRAAFGENPVGSNAEITKALAGTNPKKAKFLASGDFRQNEKGELIDRWGTPYFFHQISGEEMEIHSAGPDKRMWTADDVVAR